MNNHINKIAENGTILYLIITSIVIAIVIAISKLL